MMQKRSAERAAGEALDEDMRSSIKEIVGDFERSILRQL